VTALAGWENFYVIMGSAAGALIGLQFVVITLIASRPSLTSQGQAGSSAFATPTVVHFGAVLLLSGIMTAPWPGVASVALAWRLTGVAGIGYEIIVIRRMRGQNIYNPQFEDWLFHALLPLAAYGTLLGSAFAIRSNASGALFGVGAAALLSCSLAFTMPGMRSPITFFPPSRGPRMRVRQRSRRIERQRAAVDANARG
jgi:hypothetical protein